MRLRLRLRPRPRRKATRLGTLSSRRQWWRPALLPTRSSTTAAAVYSFVAALVRRRARWEPSSAVSTSRCRAARTATRSATSSEAPRCGTTLCRRCTDTCRITTSTPAPATRPFHSAEAVSMSLGGLRHGAHGYRCDVRWFHHAAGGNSGIYRLGFACFAVVLCTGAPRQGYVLSARTLQLLPRATRRAADTSPARHVSCRNYLSPGA